MKEILTYVIENRILQKLTLSKPVSSSVLRATGRLIEIKGKLYLAIETFHSDGKAVQKNIPANDAPDSLIKCISNLLISIAIAGCFVCAMKREWTLHNFLGGLRGILYIMIIEVVLSIPLYFLGKKYPWIKNNRKKALTIICIVLALLLIILASVFGI